MAKKSTSSEGVEQPVDSTTSVTPNTSKTKVANLSFSTPSELEVYDALAKAAAADDRSVSQFIVRVLMGKEPFELLGSTAPASIETSL